MQVRVLPRACAYERGLETVPNKRDKPDFDALYDRALRRLEGDLNAAQWPVGFDEALATARKEAERAYKTAASLGQAEEAYETTFLTTYDRVRVRPGG